MRSRRFAPSVEREASSRATAVHPSPDEALSRPIQRLGPPTGTYVFESEDRSEAFRAYEFNSPDAGSTGPRRQYRAVHEVDGGWTAGTPKGRLPLYQLRAVMKSNRAYICSNLREAAGLGKLGVTATAPPLGFQAAGNIEWSSLAGKEAVFLASDLDLRRGHLEGVLGVLKKRRDCPKIKVLPVSSLWKTGAEKPEGADLSDWLKDGVPDSWDHDDCRLHLEQVAEAARAIVTKPRDQAVHRNGDVSRADDGEGPAASDGTGPGQPKGRTTGDLLLSLVGDLRIFKSPEGNTYASVSSAGRTENLRIRSSGFSSWLAWEFYMRYRKPPGENSIKSAIGLLDAKARFDAPTLPVFVRVAERDGKLYIDLLNAARQVVEVTPGAWRVLDACPVQFLRTRAMLPLPEPRSGGSLDAIRPLVNLSSDPDWLVLAALLTYYLRSSSPFPIMVLQGEQGCAKSTTARIVRSLVDPNAVDLRSEPRGEQDLIISASNAWLVVLDNISKIHPWLSDALCRLATGGGFSKRALYTDDDEALFKVARPIVLNGITEFIERPDLIDRSVIFHLPVIPEARRREEADVKSEIASALPAAFGALLDILARAWQMLPDVQLDRKPRMADFARWGEAVARAMGRPRGAFIAAYNSNRRDANATILEESPVGVYARELMGQHERWEGSWGQLLAALEGLAGDKTRTLVDWPRSTKLLSNAMRRIAPALRLVGIDVEFNARSGIGRNRRKVSLRRIDPPTPDPWGRSSAPSAPSAGADAERGPGGEPVARIQETRDFDGGEAAKACTHDGKETRTAAGPRSPADGADGADGGRARTPNPGRCREVM